jgi:DNA-binding CsgD family transcriptional regulator
MNEAMVARLSPRQRDCLRLVWERQATSKEIAVELGISKSTVDGYIREAVEELGARDRRDAAALAFATAPRAGSGGYSPRVTEPASAEPPAVPSTEAMPAPRPWRTRSRPLNTLSFVQTLGWVSIIAIGLLAALALVMAIGNGLPPIALPMLHAFDRLTH